MLSCSVVSQLFETPLTVTHQAHLSMGNLQARILEWVAMPSSRDLPNPGIEHVSPVSPALQVDSLPLSHWGSRNAWCHPTDKLVVHLKI